MADRNHLERLSRQLADEGKLVEAGWIGLRLAAMPDNAPAVQLEAMRMAFFAGAQHLFSALISALDEGDEVTEADMRRMDLINAELQAFAAAFAAQHTPTSGEA